MRSTRCHCPNRVRFVIGRPRASQRAYFTILPDSYNFSCLLNGNIFVEYSGFGRSLAAWPERTVGAVICDNVRMIGVSV